MDLESQDPIFNVNLGQDENLIWTKKLRCSQSISLQYVSAVTKTWSYQHTNCSLWGLCNCSYSGHSGSVLIRHKFSMFTFSNVMIFRVVHVSLSRVKDSVKKNLTSLLVDPSLIFKTAIRFFLSSKKKTFEKNWKESSVHEVKGDLCLCFFT